MKYTDSQINVGSNFPNVPDDVIGVIADFLNIESILRFRQTSSRFRELVENSLYIEDSYKKLTPINTIYSDPNDFIVILKMLMLYEKKRTIDAELSAHDDTLQVVVLGKRDGMPPLPVTIARPVALKFTFPITFPKTNKNKNRTEDLAEIVKSGVLEKIKSIPIDEIKRNTHCLISCLNLYDIRYFFINMALLALSIIAIVALHKRASMVPSYVLPDALGLNCTGNNQYSEDPALITQCDATRSCSDTGIVDTLFSQINATWLCMLRLCNTNDQYNQYIFSNDGTRVSALCGTDNPFLIAYVCAIIVASIVGCLASVQILHFLQSTCFDNEIYYESPDFREKAYCARSICDTICAFFHHRKPTALESRLLDESEFTV